MTTSISEVLAFSALERKPVDCPFSHAERHPSTCKCRGTMRVVACEGCDGAGFDGKRNQPCMKCGGNGCLSASPAA